MILEDGAGDGVQFQVPLDALGVAQFNLIKVLAVFLFKLGFMHGGAGMFGQRRGVELLERHNGTSVAQLQCFVRPQVASLGDACGEGDDTAGDQGCEGFHGESPFRDILPTGLTVLDPT